MQQYTHGEIERRILEGVYGDDVRDFYRGLQVIDRDISTVRQIVESTSDPKLRNTIESYLETIGDVTKEFRTDLFKYLEDRGQQ